MDSCIHRQKRTDPFHSIPLHLAPLPSCPLNLCQTVCSFHTAHTKSSALENLCVPLSPCSLPSCCSVVRVGHRLNLTGSNASISKKMKIKKEAKIKARKKVKNTCTQSRIERLTRVYPGFSSPNSMCEGAP